MVSEARSAMQFCVQSLMPADSVSQPLAKRLSLLSELFTVLEQTGAEEVVQEALSEAARHAGIGIREVHMAYERDRISRKTARPSAQLQAAAPKTASTPKTGSQLSSPEEDLCRILITDEQLVLDASKVLPLEWVMTDIPSGTLLSALLNEAIHGEFDSIRGALGRLDDACQHTAAQIAAEPSVEKVDEEEQRRIVNGVLKSFHSRHIQSRLRSIDARIAVLPPTEIDALNLLLREKIDIRKTLIKPPAI
jgi:hypothetical protein